MASTLKKRLSSETSGYKNSKDFKMILNGTSVDSVTGRTIDIISPSSGAVIGSVPNATTDDVDLAVKAAKHAFELWRQVDIFDRRKLLCNAALAVERHEDRLAIVAVEDNGSPVRYLKGYFKRALEWLLYFANLSTELKGQTIPIPGHALCYTIREPYGVIGQMIPWNAPFVLVASHIAPALIAGNTVVLKLSELAPLADLEFVRLIGEMLPPGVLNVITGLGHTAGEALAAHPDISKLSFTGATLTGSKVMKLAADNVTPVIMELGGNNANIIFPDADIERAVQGAVSGMCLHLQGQSCYACTRLFVHEKSHDDFVTGLKKKLESIKVGLPTEESTEMGALISEDRLDRVLSYVKEGINSGAALLTGGKRLKDKQLENGYFMSPTVLTGVTKDMQFAQQSSFGPVACVFRWTEYEEMMKQVNGVTHGLSASIWTNNLQHAHSTARKLKAGYVWINQNARIYTGVPFGGVGASGFGKQICLEGLLEYTREKSIIVEL